MENTTGQAPLEFVPFESQKFPDFNALGKSLAAHLFFSAEAGESIRGLPGPAGEPGLPGAPGLPGPPAAVSVTTSEFPIAPSATFVDVVDELIPDSCLKLKYDGVSDPGTRCAISAIRLVSGSTYRVYIDQAAPDSNYSLLITRWTT